MRDEALWTVDDVANYCQVSVHTVRKWREHSKIPSLKINGVVRFVPADVRAWAAQVPIA